MCISFEQSISFRWNRAIKNVLSPNVVNLVSGFAPFFCLWKVSNEFNKLKRHNQTVNN